MNVQFESDEEVSDKANRPIVGYIVKVRGLLMV